MRLAGVVNSVVNKPETVVNEVAGEAPVEAGDTACQADRKSAGPARQTAWQQKNKVRYNAKMREFMKGYREKRKPLGIPYG